MPLCSPSIPPSIDDGRDLAAVDSFHAQLDHPVGEQQAIARVHARREAGERRVDTTRSAHGLAGGDRQPIPVAQLDRPAALEAPGANLGAAEILQNGHDASGTLGGRPDASRTSARASGACHGRS